MAEFLKTCFVNYSVPILCFLRLILLVLDMLYSLDVGKIMVPVKAENSS